MKNIKFPIVIFLQLLFLQLAIGQAQTDENGRVAGTTPAKPVVEGPVKSGGDVLDPDDADIPGTYFQQEGQDNDVVLGGAGMFELMERLDHLEAEMEKLLENTFRSVNIALVNELAQLCDRVGGISIWEVIEAAATKPFGFMPFYPGPGLGDAGGLVRAAAFQRRGRRYVERRRGLLGACRRLHLWPGVRDPRLAAPRRYRVLVAHPWPSRHLWRHSSPTRPPPSA